uniref:Uncharacterized protein n=1 Tax=viral metagenome TaxID=1070528 RepID=A0A6C0CYY4_9ZZZZ
MSKKRSSKANKKYNRRSKKVLSKVIDKALIIREKADKQSFWDSAAIIFFIPLIVILTGITVFLIIDKLLK